MNNLAVLTSNTSMGDFGGLSDEVILMIFQYLSGRDAYRLAGTCKTFKSICEGEKRMWTEVINISGTAESVRHSVYKLLSDHTKKLVISTAEYPDSRAYRSSLSYSVWDAMLNKISIGNLTELNLTRQTFSARIVTLKSFPRSLKKLNLSGTKVRHVKPSPCFFREVGEHLAELEEFDLSYCNWLFNNSVMGISKLPNLRRLNLRGCRAITDCLAYASLACRFGFKSLEMLDVTDTTVGSVEFTAFGGISTLQEFYFGQYDHFVDQQFNYIQDMCMSRIRGSRTLRVLDISGCHVTDSCLDILRTLPNLEKIDAHFTQLTKDAIDKFLRHMPNCVINKVESVPLPPGTRTVYDETAGTEALQNMLTPGQEIIEIFVDSQNNTRYRIHIHPSPDDSV